jgi:hypothetical protein
VAVDLPIRLAPIGNDWIVQAPGLSEDIVFQGGAKAEAAARALADRTSRQGHNAELRIYLRDGSLAGTFIYPSRLPPSAPAC